MSQRDQSLAIAIDTALRIVLKAAGSDLKHYTPQAKEAMRTAMCGVMYHVYDAGIEAGRTEKLQQQRVEIAA